MRFSLLAWAQMVVWSLVVAVAVLAARDMLRTERHCRMVATIAVDCR